MTNHPGQSGASGTPGKAPTLECSRHRARPNDQRAASIIKGMPSPAIKRDDRRPRRSRGQGERYEQDGLRHSIAVVAAVGAAAATHASRWYVTAAFTTFLVFLLLLFADPDMPDRASANVSEKPCSASASRTPSALPSRP
jgi:hypothetical protein